MFTGTAFFRYSEETAKLEDHMKRHIINNSGDYRVLCVGASEGREAISCAISWFDAVKAVNPTYQGKIYITCLEVDEAAIQNFKQNTFRIVPYREKDTLERLKQFASALVQNEPAQNGGPAFLREEKTISFSSQIMDNINYVKVDLDSEEFPNLLESQSLDGFNLIIYHTVERYLVNKHRVQQVLHPCLGPKGFLSYIA